MQTCCFQNRRRDIRDMSELGADFSFGFDSRRPVYNYTVRGSAVVRCDLLGPLEWSVAGPCPANRIMREGARVPPIVQMRHVNRGGADDAVQRNTFLVGTSRSAFRAAHLI